MTKGAGVRGCHPFKATARSQGTWAHRRVSLIGECESVWWEKATTGGQDKCRPRRYLASSGILTALCLPRDPMRLYYMATTYTFVWPHSHSKCSQTLNVNVATTLRLYLVTYSGPV